MKKSMKNGNFKKIDFPEKSKFLKFSFFIDFFKKNQKFQNFQNFENRNRKMFRKTFLHDKKIFFFQIFLSIIRLLVLFDSQFLSGYLDLIVPNDFPAQRRSQDGFPSFPLVFEHALLEPITCVSTGGGAGGCPTTDC